MNGMYEELIDKLRKNNRMSGWTHIDRLMDDAIKAIEALQQEIERLNKVLDDWKYNAKCDADHIAGLLADKDEQAGCEDASV